MNRNCEVCGKEFFVNRKYKKFCTIECREINREKEWNKYYIKCNHLSTSYHRETLKKILPMPCMECNCEVLEIYKKKKNENTNNKAIRINFE
jgi:hypothetical protein